MLKVKLLFCALFAMMSFTAQADEDEFVVTSGDFNVVRQPGKIGRLEVDFTQAKVGNLSTMEMTDQTFMDYLKENDQKVYKKWNEYQEEAKETFMERWNDAKKKVIKLSEKDTPAYIIKIKAAQLDPGNSGAASRQLWCSHLELEQAWWRYYHLWHIGGHRCCRQQPLQDEHQPLQRFLNERP